MVESRNDPRLTLETRRQVRCGDLERDSAVQTDIGGTIHIAHPPAANPGVNTVWTELFSRGQPGGARLGHPAGNLPSGTIQHLLFGKGVQQHRLHGVPDFGIGS
jgi:hypothetical protein